MMRLVARSADRPSTVLVAFIISLSRFAQYVIVSKTFSLFVSSLSLHLNN
jgi:hypothetical protein